MKDIDNLNIDEFFTKHLICNIHMSITTPIPIIVRTKYTMIQLRNIIYSFINLPSLIGYLINYLDVVDLNDIPTFVVQKNDDHINFLFVGNNESGSYENMVEYITHTYNIASNMIYAEIQETGANIRSEPNGDLLCTILF